MSKIKRPQLTEKEFDNIKLLQRGGFNVRTIREITKRSNSTLYLIFKCDTYQEYREALLIYRTKSREQQPQAVEVAEVNEETTQPPQELLKALENINESLLEIKDSLKWLEEHVPVVETKRNWIRRI